MLYEVITYMMSAMYHNGKTVCIMAKKPVRMWRMISLNLPMVKKFFLACRRWERYKNKQIIESSNWSREVSLKKTGATLSSRRHSSCFYSSNVWKKFQPTKFFHILFFIYWIFMNTWQGVWFCSNTQRFVVYMSINFRGVEIVITSYSIHYTKLYENPGQRRKLLPARQRPPASPRGVV